MLHWEDAFNSEKSPWQKVNFPNLLFLTKKNTYYDYDLNYDLLSKCFLQCSGGHAGLSLPGSTVCRAALMHTRSRSSLHRPPQCTSAQSCSWSSIHPPGLCVYYAYSWCPWSAASIVGRYAAQWTPGPECGDPCRWAVVVAVVLVCGCSAPTV